ncbi:MAG: hypothetical protein DIU68_010500 [Chloroflexota bacterium]
MNQDMHNHVRLYLNRLARQKHEALKTQTTCEMAQPETKRRAWGLGARFIKSLYRLFHVLRRPKHDRYRAKAISRSR